MLLLYLLQGFLLVTAILPFLNLRQLVAPCGRNNITTNTVFHLVNHLAFASLDNREQISNTQGMTKGEGSSHPSWKVSSYNLAPNFFFLLKSFRKLLQFRKKITYSFGVFDSDYILL